MYKKYLKNSKDYILHDKRIYLKDAAKKMGYSPQHLYGVLNGKIKPGPKFILALQKITKGMENDQC